MQLLANLPTNKPRTLIRVENEENEGPFSSFVPWPDAGSEDGVEYITAADAAGIVYETMKQYQFTPGYMPGPFGPGEQPVEDALEVNSDLLFAFPSDRELLRWFRPAARRYLHRAGFRAVSYKVAAGFYACGRIQAVFVPDAATRVGVRRLDRLHRFL